MGRNQWRSEKEWDRNLNTGEDINRSTKMAIAKQTIFHTPTRPAVLTLPVVPNK